MEKVEAAHSEFNREDFETARRRTRKAMDELAELMQPGMTEEEGYALAQKALKNLGVEKNWHRPFVRFGENTLKQFGEPSVPGIVLKKSDIFFLDIGPVWKTGEIEYEGDAGCTYVVGPEGADPMLEKLARDVEEVFRETEAHWRKASATGRDLYEFAFASAAKKGWLLLRETNGHRLADFPHQIYYKGSLSDVDFHPSSGLWVLEIQIRHPELALGAFYEDALKLADLSVVSVKSDIVDS